jgi:hypothetical protein
MSCTSNCNQGRACTCGRQSRAVNLIAAVIWAAAVIAIALVLNGAIK